MEVDLGEQAEALDDEEEDRALAAATATTRLVWEARLKVLSNAAFHSAASHRREAEVALLTEEMLETELRNSLIQFRAEFKAAALEQVPCAAHGDRPLRRAPLQHLPSLRSQC